MFSLNCIKICQLSSDRVSIHIFFPKLSSKLNSRNIYFHSIKNYCFFVSKKNFACKKKLYVENTLKMSPVVQKKIKPGFHYVCGIEKSSFVGCDAPILEAYKSLTGDSISK